MDLFKLKDKYVKAFKKFGIKAAFKTQNVLKKSKF